MNIDTPLIASIATGVFLAIFLIVGFARGFLRIILTTFSLIITLILAGVIAPHLADFVENSTVIGSRMQTGIEEFVESKLDPLSNTALDAENKFIDSLPITDNMKKDLKSGNTLAGYVDDGVNSFAEYMGKHLTTLIIKILSYVLLFILIFLVIRLILRLSNVINHIPVVGGVNRIFGAVVGLAEGVLFLWIICLIIMMLSGTEFGASCKQVINSSRFLKFIYDNNYLMKIIDSIVGLFKIKFR
ncbi:MAG: CvpA family protein [Parasporobacterium sp.]|nr:CvpA family protein [Parasporobacterium sp.]